MNRNIINGRPKYLLFEVGKSENSIDEKIMLELKNQLTEKIQKELNIKIVDEIPKEENGTLLICNSCSNPLIKIFRCSNCKAVNYCQRQCQVNDWKYHKLYCKYMKEHMAHLKTQVDEFSFFPFSNSKILDEHIIFPEKYNEDEENVQMEIQPNKLLKKNKTRVGGLWAIPQILDDTFTVEHRLSMTGLPCTAEEQQSSEIQKEISNDNESNNTTNSTVNNDDSNKAVDQNSGENKNDNDDDKNHNENENENKNENKNEKADKKAELDKQYGRHGELTNGFSEGFLPWCQHFSLESGFQNSPKAISGWADYFKAKNSEFYPSALLLTTPLTLFYILNTITPQFRDLPKKLSLAAETNLCIHIINPSQAHIEILELYQCLLPLIRRVTLDIFFIGPEMVVLPLSKQPKEAYVTQTLLSKRRDLSLEFKSETFESCIRLHVARCNYSNFPIDKYPPDLVLCINATRNLLSKRVEIKDDEYKCMDEASNEKETENNNNTTSTSSSVPEDKNKDQQKQSASTQVNIFKHEVVNTIRTKLSKPYETTACIIVESTETECEIGKRILKQECEISNPNCTGSVQVNPFRQPWLNRYPNMNVPRWRNGFIYGFKI